MLEAAWAYLDYLAVVFIKVNQFILNKILFSNFFPELATPVIEIPKDPVAISKTKRHRLHTHHVRRPISELPARATVS